MNDAIRIDTSGGIRGRDIDNTAVPDQTWDRGGVELRRCTQVLEDQTEVEVIELTFRDDEDTARIAIELPKDACDALTEGLKKLWRIER